MKSILLGLIFIFNVFLIARIDDRIDINIANIETLMTLYGITERDAENIIKYRNEHGEFKKIEELIPIIGGDKFETIKYDIKVVPIKYRYRDALSGYFYIENYHLVSGTANQQVFGKFKFKIYDAVEIYMNKYKSYYSYKDLFFKKKWNYFRNVTFNIYKREPINNPNKPIPNHPEIQVFKTIDLVEEKQKEASDALEFLDEYFEAKPKLYKDKKNITGIEYAYSDFDVLDYLKSENSKKVANDFNKAKVRYIRKDKEYPQLPEDELPSEREDNMKKIENKRKYRKKLKQKILLGNFFLPRVNSPLVVKSSSEQIRGIKINHYEDDWDTSIFYGNVPKRNGELYGAEFNFDLSKYSGISLIGYQFEDNTMGNNFPCLAIKGYKSFKGRTQFEVEYDNVFDRAYGLYAKLSTMLKNYGLSLSLQSVTPTYRDKDNLYPFWTSYNSFQGFTKGYFRLSYRFLKSSSLTFDISETEYKDSYYISAPIKRRYSSIKFDYEPLGKWSFNLIASYSNNNYADYKFKNSLQIYSSYKPDKTSKWKFKFKNYMYPTKRSTSHTIQYVKYFKKLSISPEIVFTHPDIETYIELDYKFDKHSSFGMFYDNIFDKQRDGTYDITRVYHFEFKTSF